MAMIPRIQHEETVPSTPNFASAPPIHAPHPSEQERTCAESVLMFAGPAGVAKLIAPPRRCETAMAAAMRSCKDPSGEGWMGKLGPLVGYGENLSAFYAY
jgi:hypothetical protein